MICYPRPRTPGAGCGRPQTAGAPLSIWLGIVVVGRLGLRRCTLCVQGHKACTRGDGGGTAVCAVDKKPCARLCRR